MSMLCAAPVQQAEAGGIKVSICRDPRRLRTRTAPAHLSHPAQQRPSCVLLIWAPAHPKIFIGSFIHCTPSSPQISCVAADIPWQPSSPPCLGHLHIQSFSLVHSFIACLPVRRSGALQQTFHGSPPARPVLGTCTSKGFHSSNHCTPSSPQIRWVAADIPWQPSARPVLGTCTSKDFAGHSAKYHHVGSLLPNAARGTAPADINLSAALQWMAGSRQVHATRRCSKPCGFWKPPRG